MNRVLRVELTEEERRELDKYLISYPFGQISHILRHAVRGFIRAEREKVEKAILTQKEAQNGYQSGERKRTKKT